jgi:hypothetical protein
LGASMVAHREYDLGMGRLNAALGAAFAVAAILLFAVSPAAAQIKGTPTSVTSIGFGGHFDRVPGTPASVTSLGPRGYNDPTHLFVGSAFPPANPGQMHHHPPSGEGHPNEGHHGGRGVRGFYPVYTPVYVVDPSMGYTPDDAGNSPNGTAVENQDYPSGPTIFDRRASGQSSQSVEATYAQQRGADQSREEPVPVAAAPVPAEAAPVRDQPQTLLMFKDGRQLEVGNYAIVGNMLYDMTPGHRSRIALSDLDLAATAKENDERGVDFQVPAGSGLD